MRDGACNVYRRCRGGPSASLPCRHEQSEEQRLGLSEPNPLPYRRLRSHASWAGPGGAPSQDRGQAAKSGGDSTRATPRPAKHVPTRQTGNEGGEPVEMMQAVLAMAAQLGEAGARAARAAESAAAAASLAHGLHETRLHEQARWSHELLVRIIGNNEMQRMMGSTSTGAPPQLSEGGVATTTRSVGRTTGPGLPGQAATAGAEVGAARRWTGGRSCPPRPPGLEQGTQGGGAPQARGTLPGRGYYGAVDAAATHLISLMVDAHTSRGATADDEANCGQDGDDDDGDDDDAAPQLVSPSLRRVRFGTTSYATTYSKVEYDRGGYTTASRLAAMAEVAAERAVAAARVQRGWRAQRARRRATESAERAERAVGTEGTTRAASGGSVVDVQLGEGAHGPPTPGRPSSQRRRRRRQRGRRHAQGDGRGGGAEGATAAV